MALKRALITQAMGSGTQPFSVDIQDANAGFSDDIKVALFAHSYNSSVNTSLTGPVVMYGAAVDYSGTTKHNHLSVTNNNNVATTAAVASHNDPGGASAASVRYGSTYAFSVSDWDTDHVTITHAISVATARYGTALLLGGDIEANVVMGQFSANNSIDVSHGLSGAPEIILVLTNLPDSIPDSDARHVIGFYAGGSQVCYSASLLTGVSPQPLGAQVLDNYVAASVSSTSGTPTGAVEYKYQLSSIGASTVTCKSYNDAGTLTNCGTDLVFVFIRGTTTPITAKCGIYTTPTVSGTHSIGAALGVKPQGLILVPTRMTAVNTADTTDAAGQYGMFMAVDRSGTSATQQGGVVMTVNEGGNAGNTYTRSHQRDDCVLRLTQATGGDEAVATVNAWQSNDVELNYSTAPSAAYKIPYLMFGVADLTKKLKLTTHSSAASASSVAGVVFAAPTGGAITGNKIGEFTGATFEATLESNKAVLKVPVSEFGGTSLTTSDTPVALVRTSTKTTGIKSCTIIEE